MNMHREKLTCRLAILFKKRCSPDIEFKVFGFSGAFLFPKREAEIGMCARNAAPSRQARFISDGPRRCSTFGLSRRVQPRKR